MINYLIFSAPPLFLCSLLLTLTALLCMWSWTNISTLLNCIVWYYLKFKNHIFQIFLQNMWTYTDKVNNWHDRQNLRFWNLFWSTFRENYFPISENNISIARFHPVKKKKISYEDRQQVVLPILSYTNYITVRWYVT